MIVEYHDGFKNPTTKHVTRIVITDDAGNPIIAAVDNGDKSFSITYIGEGSAVFNQSLKEMGINKSVVLQEVELK